MYRTCDRWLCALAAVVEVEHVLHRALLKSVD